MTAIRRSDSQLDAEAAANSAVRAVTSAQTRYSPMGAMPPALFCGSHPGMVTVYDRHGSPHRTTCCLIHEARREWHYAHPERLHVARVPSDLEWINDGSDVWGGHMEGGGGAAVLDAGELGGPAYAPAFVTYLHAPREPIVRGLREYRRKCAGHHAEWAEHRGRAVCGMLLWSVIANGNPISEAADSAELTPERATDLLGTALRLIWRWRSQQVNGI